MSFSKIVWCFILSTYNIPPPTNIKNMFGDWLNGIDKKTKHIIPIGGGSCGERVVDRGVIWRVSGAATPCEVESDE
jgi:hypothetical protein